MTFADVVKLSTYLGYHEGESYDESTYVNDGQNFIIFKLAGIEQFYLQIEYTNETDWSIKKVVPVGFLLQENGDKILQETNDAILVEGLIPA